MKRNVLTRVLCVLVALLMLCGSLTAAAITAADGEEHSGVVSPETISKRYEIAVAYDNSGSMYNNASWYQAKYAMEIFASMIDFNNGDKLTVFPMHPVTTDGNENSTETMQVTVSGVSDIDKIHNMYTPNAGGTPFGAAVDAYNYLLGEKSDSVVCWLIVLTDGSFQEDDCDVALMNMSQNVNVQYIPFGKGSVEYSDKSGNDNFHACPKITTEKELQKQMIDICNKITQRDILDGYLSGSTLKLELSMKKVIVFAQGDGASITSLKDAGGNEIKKLVNSGPRKYSELGTRGAEPLPDSLKNQTGQVVTFDACAKGEYTLEYSNADDIQVFYEPDVAMVIDFIDEDGNVEDFSDGEIREGEYTYKVKIIDAKTGEDVSTHKLLGGNVQINGTATYPGLFSGGKEIDLKNGDKVTFTPGEDVEFDIWAQYLEKYYLRSLDSIDIDWSKIDITPRTEELKVEATVEQEHEWYSLPESDQWKPIRLDLSIAGSPLTDDQLDGAEVVLEFDDPNQNIVYRLERLHGESAINVHIGRDDAGNFTAPAVDVYKGKATVTVTDRFSNRISGWDNFKFTVSEHSYSFFFWKWVIIIAAALILLVVLLGFPVKPKIVYLVIGVNTFTFFPKKKSAFKVQYSRNNNQSFIFKAECKTHWRWFKNSWLKNVFKRGDMSFKLEVDSKANSISNLTIESDPVVDGYIGWQDGNQNRSANVFTNRKD